jgi:hypothetical protein
MRFILRLALLVVLLELGKSTLFGCLCPHMLTWLRAFRHNRVSNCVRRQNIELHPLYLLYGPENIAAIWKYKTSITSPCVHSLCLRNVFGMAPKAVKMYGVDTSGILPKLNFHSIVASHNRVDYHTHAGFYRLFNGKGLLILYDRWPNNFTSRREH